MKSRGFVALCAVEAGNIAPYVQTGHRSVCTARATRRMPRNRDTIERTKTKNAKAARWRERAKERSRIPVVNFRGSRAGEGQVLGHGCTLGWDESHWTDVLQKIQCRFSRVGNFVSASTSLSMVRGGRIRGENIVRSTCNCGRLLWVEECELLFRVLWDFEIGVENRGWSRSLGIFL